MAGSQFKFFFIELDLSLVNCNVFSFLTKIFHVPQKIAEKSGRNRIGLATFFLRIELVGQVDYNLFQIRPSFDFNFFAIDGIIDE